jgi:ribosomal protein L11 methyltransferase
MPPDYIEVRLQTTVDPGELLGFLGLEEISGAWESDGVVHLYWPADRWIPEILEIIKKALQELGDRNPAAFFAVDRIPDQDWNELWAKSIQPIRVGRRILIRQSWNQEPPRTGEIELVIDPKRAFGSGHHASTQLLMEWLEDGIRGGERVLDVGTGSGILGMVALRLGAAWVLGIDHDPTAIECAHDYAAINGFGSELDLRTASIGELSAGNFDLVVANLDFSTLLACVDPILRCVVPGGTLVISGICPEDYQEISTAYSAAGAFVRDRRDRDEWMALEIGVRLLNSQFSNRGEARSRR